MFFTLTCPSYGRVNEDGTPADPAAYGYQQAARDALHFAALFDRFTQNLRRVLGYDVQYFATIEPQRRLAPHVHVAMRRTLSRAELRQIIGAALGNRTPDLRITRRIRVVRCRPAGHFCPACPASSSARVRSSLNLLLASALAPPQHGSTTPKSWTLGPRRNRWTIVRARPRVASTPAGLGQLRCDRQLRTEHPRNLRKGSPVQQPDSVWQS